MRNIVCLLCLSTVVAHADTTLKYTADGGAETSLIQLIDGKVHMKSQGEDNVSTIYDAETGVFTTLMHDEKQYMSFGPKEIEAMGNMAAIMKAEMEKQLAQMPEAQREQMRDMMMNMLEQQMPKQGPKPSYNKTGMSKSYNGISCEIVVKTSGDQNSGSFCVAEYDDLGISKGEYNAISSLMKVAEKITAQTGEEYSMNFSSLGAYVPVQFDMNNDNGILQSVSHDTIDRAVFTIPADYKKQELGLDILQ